MKNIQVIYVKTRLKAKTVVKYFRKRGGDSELSEINLLHLDEWKWAIKSRKGMLLYECMVPC
jgi:hypothetical protein